MKQQTYNDGVVVIYDAQNASTPGRKPVLQLAKKLSLRYKERTVGVTRHFTALQAEVKIDRVIRCQLHKGVTTQDIAQPNGGRYYRIVLIQYPEDIEPPVMDLTLQEVQETVETV